MLYKIISDKKRLILKKRESKIIEKMQKWKPLELGGAPYKGKRDYISEIKFKLRNILNSLNFEEIATNDIVTLDENFEMLNIPLGHPTRDEHKIINFENDLILRSHSTTLTPALINKIKSGEIEKLNERNLFTIGRVFRDDKDRTHIPCFHQLDFIIIGKNNIEYLEEIFKNIISKLIDKPFSLRFRNSYFPFTQPSLEADIKIGEEWLELSGMGILKDNISMQLIDSPSNNVLACGMGIERIAMIANNFADIKKIYLHND